VLPPLFCIAEKVLSCGKDMLIVDARWQHAPLTEEALEVRHCEKPDGQG